MAKGTAEFNKEVNDFLDNMYDEGFKQADDLISIVIQKYIEKWQKNLHDRGINASYNLSQSIGAEGKNGTGFNYEFDKDGKLTGIKLYLPEYYEYTDSGRRPTKGSGIGAVRSKLPLWIAQKKLIPSGGIDVKQKRKLKSGEIKIYTRHLTAKQANKSLSFLISRKIHKNGFSSAFQKRRHGWFSDELKGFERELVEAFNKVFSNIGEIKITINP